MGRKGKSHIVAALSGRNIRNIRRFGLFGNVFQGAGKLLRGGDAQVFQLLGPGDEPVFKRGNGFVVLGYRLVQALAQRGKMTGKDRAGIVQVRSRFRNFLGVIRQLLLLPSVSDGFQQGNQGGWGGKNDFILRAEFNQGGVCFQSRLEKDSPGRNIMTNSGHGENWAK